MMRKFFKKHFDNLEPKISESSNILAKLVLVESMKFILFAISAPDAK